MKLFTNANFENEFFPALTGKKGLVTCLFIVLVVGNMSAQSRVGITGTRDTSYTTYSAFINTLKTHPGSKLAGEIKLSAIREKRNISYCIIGDRKLKLDVFLPAKQNETPAIAIIIIHGGGWRSGNRNQHYPLAQKLASLGYVCFTPEYRLSTEALFPAGVYDIKAAIRWVRANAVWYKIDTSRLVMLGFSAGGELAAFMGTTGNMPLFEGVSCNMDQASNVNAVIDIDGILSFVHPESGEGDDSKRTSAATHWFGYPKLGSGQLWQAASPLSYAGSNTPATLFINSSVARMHAGRDDYIKVLNQFHIYSEVHTFEDAPHSFCLFDPWFAPTVQYIDEFLKKVLKYQN